jgi:hypothetical protein
VSSPFDLCACLPFSLEAHVSNLTAARLVTTVQVNQFSCPVPLTEIRRQSLVGSSLPICIPHHTGPSGTNPAGSTAAPILSVSAETELDSLRARVCLEVPRLGVSSSLCPSLIVGDCYHPSVGRQSLLSAADLFVPVLHGGSSSPLIYSVCISPRLGPRGLFYRKQGSLVFWQRVFCCFVFLGIL